MKNHYLPLLMTILVCTNLLGQNSIIDSLNNELSLASTDSSKIRVLNSLAKEFFRIDPPKTQEYATKALQLSEKNGDSLGIGESNRMMGFWYESQNQNDSAFYYYEIALDIFRKQNYLLGQSDATNDLGALYYRISDFDKAASYLKESIAINEKLSNDFGVARANFNLGNLYSDQGKWKEAKAVFEESKVVFDRLEHLTGQTVCLVSLGIVLKEQGDHNKSLIMYDSALIIANELGNKYMLAKIHNNIGVVYELKAKMALAIENYHKSLALYEELNNAEGQSETFDNIGVVYRQMGELETAKDYFLKAHQTAVKTNSPFDRALTLNNLGSVSSDLGDPVESIRYYRMSYNITDSLKSDCGFETAACGIGYGYLSINQLDSAEKYLRRCYVASGECNNPTVKTYAAQKMSVLLEKNGRAVESLKYLKESYDLATKHDYQLELKTASFELYNYYKQRNRYELALRYHEEFQRTSDSIFNESSTKKIANLEAQFEFDKEKQAMTNQIDLLAANNKIKDLELQSKQNLLAGIGASSILIILVLIGFYSRRNYKIKAQWAEEKEEQQKQRFKSVIEAEEKERKRIAQELHDGLGQLLSSARLNVSAMEDNFSELVINQWKNSIKLIDDAVDEVRTISHNMMPNALVTIGFEAALKEQIHIINEAGQITVHSTFPDHAIDIKESEAIAIYRIIQEILNNALKYSEAKNIWIDVQGSGNLTIKIKDDGKGFDTASMESSSGIGWKNIQSRIEILNGELSVKSDIGAGSEIQLKMAV